MPVGVMVQVIWHIMTTAGIMPPIMLGIMFGMGIMPPIMFGICMNGIGIIVGIVIMPGVGIMPGIGIMFDIGIMGIGMVAFIGGLLVPTGCSVASSPGLRA